MLFKRGYTVGMIKAEISFYLIDHPDYRLEVIGIYPQDGLAQIVYGSIKRSVNFDVGIKELEQLISNLRKSSGLWKEKTPWE
jgi:hypothetical protein